MGSSELVGLVSALDPAEEHSYVMYNFCFSL